MPSNLPPQDDAEFDRPCPICFDNEDDAYVDGHHSGMCNACGNFYCGACNKGGISAKTPNCAMCRAPFRATQKEKFRRLRKLIFGRSPGRHTHVAQCNIGAMYAAGHGVNVDHAEAEKWYRLSAEGGFAGAQFTLGSMYAEGLGILKQDHAEAIKWLLRSANNGHTEAQVNLAGMYLMGNGVARNLHVTAWRSSGSSWPPSKATAAPSTTFVDCRLKYNQIPTPETNTDVTTILLTSAKAAKYNNRSGKVVGDGAVAAKSGRAAVLLDGEAVPMSFKLMNLRCHVHPASSAGAFIVDHLDTETVDRISPLRMQSSAVDRSGDLAFRQHFTDADESTPTLDIALVVALFAFLYPHCFSAASAVAIAWVLAGASG